MMIIAVIGAVAVIATIVVVYFKCKAKSTLGQSPEPAKSVEVLGDAHDLKNNYNKRISTNSFDLKSRQATDSRLNSPNSPNSLGITQQEPIKFTKLKGNKVLPKNAS